MEANLTFSLRHAQKYMKVAANASRVTHLGSLREAVKLLAEPKDEPEEGQGILEFIKAQPSQTHAEVVCRR